MNRGGIYSNSRVMNLDQIHGSLKQSRKRVMDVSLKIFFAVSNRQEGVDHPNLTDIINTIPSLSELQKWARENGMKDHPIVQQRMDFILSEILHTFNDSETLTHWAIEHSVLTNNQVLQKYPICRPVHIADSNSNWHPTDVNIRYYTE